MADFVDFLGGASRYLLDRQTTLEQEKRDMEKQKALEALRRETSDYKYARGRNDSLKQVDAKQSYLDPTSRKYVMVNSEGKEIGRRDATSSELAADSLTGLKIEDMKTDIAYKRKLTANVGASSGGGGGNGRISLDAVSSEDVTTNKLQAMASTVVGNLRKYGLPQDMIARAESVMRSQINSGKASPKWIREFEARYLDHPQVKGSLRASEAAKAAKDIFGDE